MFKGPFYQVNLTIGHKKSIEFSAETLSVAREYYAVALQKLSRKYALESTNFWTEKIKGLEGIAFHSPSGILAQVWLTYCGVAIRG